MKEPYTKSKNSWESKTKMGRHFSKEHRKKISESKMGEKNPFYGKHHSEELRRKWSIERKGIKNPMFGRQHSEEAKRKIGEKNTINNRGRIPWNKGKILSIEGRKKLSKSHKPEAHPNWKGGIRKSNNRIFIYSPAHPYAHKQGYVLRARLVMEQILGRYLEPEETVHHKNEITDDDQPENLQLFASSGKHSSFHANQKRIQKLIGEQ